MKWWIVIDEQNLQEILLSWYNSNLRPGINRSIPLEVSFKFHLFYIKEFRESISKFTVNGAFVIEWKDERLKWNPDSYNNLTTISFPQKEIWIPNLININPYREMFGLCSYLMSVQVDSKEFCLWVSYRSFDVICDADVAKYPFDTQYCTLNFFMWSYKRNSVNINITLPTVGFFIV